MRSRRNASIDGNDVVYHGYQDIGVAVSSPRGLVVPVLRNADHMSMAVMERQIAEFGEKARDLFRWILQSSYA